MLRLGYKYTGKSSWTAAHMCYLRNARFAHPAHQTLLEESVLAITQGVERVERLNAQIDAHAKSWKQKAACEALMAMRGVESLTAGILLSEIGDIRRFEHPCKLMGFLGLVPSEYSSSISIRKGSITKCGNHHARWLITEMAHHYVRPPKVSYELSRRQETASRRIKELSWNAQTRLHKRFCALVAKGKNRQKAIIAIARELLGFIWAVLHEHHQPGSIAPRAITPTVSRKRSYELQPACS